jgi:hypothetical protein
MSSKSPSSIWSIIHFPQPKPPACYIPYPSLLGLITHIVWWAVQVTNVLGMQFAPLPLFRPPTQAQIASSTPCSLLDQLSQPYETTTGIILITWCMLHWWWLVSGSFWRLFYCLPTWLNCWCTSIIATECVYLWSCKYTWSMARAVVKC